MSKFFREPLVHFIILGGLLFVGHALWQSHVTRADYTITVSAEEIQRQALIFAGENRRQPTDEDIQALVFAHVEEEALMREADRLGLGEDDTIIRRRLAQKMRFLIEDVDAPALPDEAELNNWFEANIERFIRPETRSFSHIYLSPEQHGERIEADAQILLQATAQEDWKTLGDPFMMKREFKNLSIVEISRLFGADFAKSLSIAEGGNWQGPIESAFGLHLIRIDGVTPKVTPTLADVRGEVETAWQDQALRKANTERLKTLIKKYKVNVEELEE